MLYVLDSTVLIDYLRGRPVVQRVRALHDRGEAPATTAINVEEIVRGARPAERAAVDALFDGLAVLSVGRHAAERAGAWRRDLASTGVSITQADALIAATTWVHGGTLATGNPRDFPHDELVVEHWPVGG